MRTYNCIVSHIVCNRVSGDRYLDYTPAPAPAPDPQAEIAALRAERDALLDSNAALRSNMSRIAGRAYEARTPDISADTRKTLQDIEYIALDMGAGSEPGA